MRRAGFPCLQCLHESSVHYAGLLKHWMECDRCGARFSVMEYQVKYEEQLTRAARAVSRAAGPDDKGAA